MSFFILYITQFSHLYIILRTILEFLIKTWIQSCIPKISIRKGDFIFV